MNNLVFILGTRPEAIKLSPIVCKAREEFPAFKPHIFCTGQHPQLAVESLRAFGLFPDKSLENFRDGQNLSQLLGNVLISLGEHRELLSKSVIVVQGDTTSALAGALAGFYFQAPVIHVEAGLRSFDLSSPFPEEMNRKLISNLTTLHFAPTKSNLENLISEGVPEGNIVISGNTVIDALLMITRSLPSSSSDLKRVLVTLHRRENQSSGMIDKYTYGLLKVAEKYPNVEFIVVKHPNKEASKRINQDFLDLSNVYVKSPLPYTELMSLLKSTTVIVTDSGGLQEEATFLGIPTLILRNETERAEAITYGPCKLIGGNVDLLQGELSKLLSDESYYRLCAKPSHVFGSGISSEIILNAISRRFGVQ